MTSGSSELTFSGIINDLKFFLVPLSIFWLAGGIFMLYTGYRGSFEILNTELHYGKADVIMHFLTHLADGILLPLLILLLSWKKDFALPLTALFSIVLTGLVAQLLKRLIFDDWHRPPMFVGEMPGITIVPGNAPMHHSFPSGHATSFASGGVMIAWLFRRNQFLTTALIGVLTVLLCYTRVYIGVHFFGDILAGSLLGVLGSVVVLRYLYPKMRNWIGSRNFTRLRRYSVLIFVLAAVLFILRYIQMVMIH